MYTYEAMFIFKPGLREEEQKELVGKLEDLLKENQATIENSQVFGKRSLAFEISKHKEGLYYLMNFSHPSGAVVSKLKQTCNIDEKILRTLVIRTKPKPAI